jgi:hypothetical protein
LTPFSVMTRCAILLGAGSPSIRAHAPIRDRHPITEYRTQAFSYYSVYIRQ